MVFGVTGADGSQRTLCGTASLADGIWHHVAVQRRLSDGWMSIYIDGALDAEADGPDGNIAYPDDATPLSLCGTGGTSACANDPYLVFGAEKHDQLRSTYLSFHGWLDEIRLSNVLRYASSFTRPASRFSTDANTVGLWHFDEGYGNVIRDNSVPNGPSLGDRNYGGVTNGPEWTDDTVWYVPPPSPSPTPTASPTATATATVTPTSTATATATNTPTPTITPTPTPFSAPTPSPIPPLVFAVIGDYGLDSQPEDDVATLVHSWSPAFIVTTGDNNYPDGERSLIDDNVGKYYADFIYPYTGVHGPGATENRFFPSLGNHDWNSEDGAPYFDYFTLPGNERYYSFVRGAGRVLHPRQRRPRSGWDLEVVGPGRLAAERAGRIDEPVADRRPPRRALLVRDARIGQHAMAVCRVGSRRRPGRSRSRLRAAGGRRDPVHRQRPGRFGDLQLRHPADREPGALQRRLRRDARRGQPGCAGVRFLLA